MTDVTTEDPTAQEPTVQEASEEKDPLVYTEQNIGDLHFDMYHTRVKYVRLKVLEERTVILLPQGQLLGQKGDAVMQREDGTYGLIPSGVVTQQLMPSLEKVEVVDATIDTTV